MMAVARHESAHAVAAWLTGCRLNFLTITGPMKRETPFYSSQKFPIVDDDLNIDDVSARLAACVSPGVVCGLDYGELNDIREFMKIITWGTPSGAEMAKTAAELMDKHGEDWQQSAQEFFDKYAHHARELVETDAAKKAIDGLAKELERKGRLSGFEVAHFLEKVWPGPLPEKVLPAGEHLTSLDSKTATHEDNMQAARRLLNMAYESIPLTDATESARESVLQSIFKLAGVEL